MTLAEAALTLASRGYHVFPVRPRGREPAIGKGGFHHATTDERQILHWWAATPDANVGVACGASGVCVWDIDSKAGADPEDVLGELDIAGAPLIRTGEAPEPSDSHPHSLSGVRGAQVYFRGQLAGTDKLTVAGTEIRGTGQYVVAPPSIHPSGVRYEGELPAVAELPEVPLWLLAMRRQSENGRVAAPLPETIHAGAGRNNALASLAGSLRRRGVAVEEIAAALHAVNASRCQPPLPGEEVVKIARSISRYDPVRAAPKSDLETAQQFASEYGDAFRFVHDERTWLAWDGSRWRRDATGEVERAAKATAFSLLERAGSIRDEGEAKAAARWALQARGEPRIRAMLALARSELELAITADAVDSDPLLLGCANGIIDLRTGELHEHDPAKLISRGSELAYEPDAPCPRWERFLREVFARDEGLTDPDFELIDFVRRLCGYCLTGLTTEEVLAIFFGAGCNGKSTVLRVLKQLLGDLALASPFETFMRARSDRAPRNDLARLHRARLVMANESGEGKQLDEATVKQLTGRDVIACRFLHAEFFEYVPRFKLLLSTNHRPRVDGSDDALWRRLRLIPFERSFEGREDRTLDATLESELPGILAWAVRGCLDWQREGLGSAAAVMSATGGYRQEEDTLGAFLEERCALEGEIEPTRLREALGDYCREIGEKPPAANVLGKQLARRGIERNKRLGVYRGVTLR